MGITTSRKYANDIFQPSVLVNRFMLNLRQVRTDSNFQSYYTTIPQFQVSLPDPEHGAFASIIGNISEPLVHGETEEDGLFS
jgi:hypothetical protein